MTLRLMATFRKCSNKQQVHSYEKLREPWTFKDKDELYLKIQFVPGSKHTPLFTKKQKKNT